MQRTDTLFRRAITLAFAFALPTANAHGESARAACSWLLRTAIRNEATPIALDANSAGGALVKEAENSVRILTLAERRMPAALLLLATTHNDTLAKKAQEILDGLGIQHRPGVVYRDFDDIDVELPTTELTPDGSHAMNRVAAIAHEHLRGMTVRFSLQRWFEAGSTDTTGSYSPSDHSYDLSPARLAQGRVRITDVHELFHGYNQLFAARTLLAISFDSGAGHRYVDALSFDELVTFLLNARLSLAALQSLGTDASEEQRNAVAAMLRLHLDRNQQLVEWALTLVTQEGPFPIHSIREVKDETGRREAQYTVTLATPRGTLRVPVHSAEAHERLSRELTDETSFRYHLLNSRDTVKPILASAAQQSLAVVAQTLVDYRDAIAPAKAFYAADSDLSPERLAVLRQLLRQGSRKLAPLTVSVDARTAP